MMSLQKQATRETRFTDPCITTTVSSKTGLKGLKKLHTLESVALSLLLQGYKGYRAVSEDQDMGTDRVIFKEFYCAEFY